jgi:cytochrome c biogenesis factor
MVDLQDFFGLLHPMLAVIVVFPLIGMVVRLAVQTRQRRLQVDADGKSKISPVVGKEHVQLGKWLSGAVVGVALLGMAYPIFSKLLDPEKQLWAKEPFRFFFIIAIYAATIASLVILYNARPKVWRAIFATLAGMGVIILGFQPEIFRRNDEWYVSHFYYGMIATMLMIFSLAIIQEIYQDRQNRWRMVHIVLNSIALLFFIGQGITGTRDLLEIPLSWQEPYIYQCDFAAKKCPEPAPK